MFESLKSTIKLDKQYQQSIETLYEISQFFQNNSEEIKKYGELNKIIPMINVCLKEYQDCRS